MILPGLNKILPDARDFSLVSSFGATTFDIKGLPQNFSIYDGRVIPDQNLEDDRFTPPVHPLPYGCTGESQSFIGGLEDDALYYPDDLYNHTPPFKGDGRDMRPSLQTTIDWGFKNTKGEIGNKRTAYYNCYGTGGIDDFDAARIALWINQAEKRPVSVGSWWYLEFGNPTNGSLPLPSFNTKIASLHNYIATGWRTKNDIEELEILSWQGMEYGRKGVVYMSRVLYNALMAQPYTGAFTLTKDTSATPIPVGFQAILDHFVYWFRNLLHV